MQILTQSILTENAKKLYVFITRIALPLCCGVFVLSICYWVLGPLYQIEHYLLQKMVGIGLLILAIILLIQSFWYYHYPPGKGEIVTAHTDHPPTEEDYGSLMENKRHVYHRIYTRKIRKTCWEIIAEIY